MAVLACLVVGVVPHVGGVGADPWNHGHLHNDNDGSGSNNGNLDQQLAVPAIDPTADPAAWTDLTQAETDTLGIVVANVDSGPDSQPVPAWASAIDATHAAGAKVLGYVDTGYLGSPITGFSNGLYTRSSLTGFQAWLPQIEADINAWYQFYGNDLDGIFFDEATNTCGPTPSSDLYAQEYQTLTAYVKDAHPGAVTVLNPGTAVPSCYENSADVLVTFEGSSATTRAIRSLLSRPTNPSTGHQSTPTSSGTSSTAPPPRPRWSRSWLSASHQMPGTST